MREVTLEEFQAELIAQDVPEEHLAFRCPMCGTIQSAFDLIAAGAGEQYEDVDQYLAFSCVGRWLDRKPPPGVPGRGCDWTLGGFIAACNLVVVTPDGQRHPRFEPCSKQEAIEHRDRLRTPMADG